MSAAAKTVAAEVVNPEPLKVVVAPVGTETDSVVGQVRTLRDSLLQKREALQGQLEKLDSDLAELGFTAPVAPVVRRAVRTTATKTTTTNTGVGRGKGARSGNKFTLIEAALNVIPPKSDVSLTWIAQKILAGGYNTKNPDPKAFEVNVYTGAVNKLVKSGVLATKGAKPNTTYFRTGK